MSFEAIKIPEAVYANLSLILRSCDEIDHIQISLILNTFNDQLNMIVGQRKKYRTSIQNENQNNEREKKPKSKKNNENDSTLISLVIPQFVQLQLAKTIGMI